MADPKQIPYIIKLLDDDSPTVQRAVAAALASFGPALEEELAQLDQPPSDSQLRQIQALVELHTSGASDSVEKVSGEPLFRVGQLVRHRRYNYRGVVVEFDPTCQADDSWYFANRSQPERLQPWYHVLVHETNQVTYAAQTSLMEDDSADPVVHPMIPQFFSAFKEGQYTRNDTPWPA